MQLRQGRRRALLQFNILPPVQRTSLVNGGGELLVLQLYTVLARHHPAAVACGWQLGAELGRMDGVAG